MTGIADLFEDPAIEPVSVDGKTMHVRELTGLELYECYESAEKRGSSFVAQLLGKSVCDAEGRQLATEKDIRRLPKRWVDALFDAAKELNGIGDQEKNSEADPS